MHAGAVIDRRCEGNGALHGSKAMSHEVQCCSLVSATERILRLEACLRRCWHEGFCCAVAWLDAGAVCWQSKSRWGMRRCLQRGVQPMHVVCRCRNLRCDSHDDEAVCAVGCTVAADAAPEAHLWLVSMPVGSAWPGMMLRFFVRRRCCDRISTCCASFLITTTLESTAGSSGHSKGSGGQSGLCRRVAGV